MGGGRGVITDAFPRVDGVLIECITWILRDLLCSALFNAAIPETVEYFHFVYSKGKNMV